MGWVTGLRDRSHATRHITTRSRVPKSGKLRAPLKRKRSQPRRSCCRLRCGQRSCGVRADPCASVLRSIAHASSIVCSTCAQLAHIWLTLMFLLHVIVCTCVPRLWKVPFSAGVWRDDDHMEGGAAAVATQALREAVRLCVCVGAEVVVCGSNATVLVACAARVTTSTSASGAEAHRRGAIARPIARTYSLLRTRE